MYITSFLLAFLILVVQSAPTVKIANGIIQGSQCQVSNSINFLGIPFAQPPTGELRWASPLPYTSSYNGGTLDATTLKPACLQFGSPGGIGYINSATSEDCLYLNIFTPARMSGTSTLPVKVFAYGGSFISGGNSDPLYDGCYLATDAIIVTLNYRLGPLGFLALPDAGIQGNQGLQDVMLGIQWVKENIQAFGGNASQILLFGESAGAGLAWIVSTLDVTPSVLSAVISESGVGIVLPTISSYESFPCGKFAQNIGCNTSDIACLQSKTTQEVLGANPPTSTSGQSYWYPYLDGTIIPTQPAEVPAKVPFLAGTNANEGTLFASAAGYTPSSLTVTQYEAILNSTFGVLAPLVQLFYPLANYANSPPSPTANHAPYYAFSQIYTDVGFLCPTRRYLRLTAASGMSTYNYFFSHTPNCFWETAFSTLSTSLRELGATHSSELQFVFNRTAQLPPPSGDCSQTRSELDIDQTITKAWTSMARQGNPGSGWPSFGTGETMPLGGTASADYTACDLLWDPYADTTELLTVLENILSSVL